MTRNWAPLEGPQRVVMRLRAKQDGRPRSFTDFELPLMVLLAVVVGVVIAMWLNGLASPGGGEVRLETERPPLTSPRQAIAAGAAERAQAARRERARAQRRVRAARVLAARKRAAAAAFARRTYTETGPGSSTSYPATRQDFQGTNQTYTQQTLPVAPAPKQDAAPAPKPKPSNGGGGGGGFDDSG